jgi:uncharacterized protein
MADVAPAPEVPFRILPQLTDRNRHFWTGGSRGELVFLACEDCGYLIHPPQPVCPQCHSKRLGTRVVAGTTTLATYSINHQAWMPGPELPYVVAIVEIDEQPSVRLTTNLVNCAHHRIEVGMPVRVVFEHHSDPDGNPDDDIYIPLFEPTSHPSPSEVSR